MDPSSQGPSIHTANNHVSCKFQLDIVTVIIIYYSRVDIFYLCMKRERHALPWNMEKKSKRLIEKCLQPDLSLSNGVVKRHNLDHMVFFTLMLSSRKNIS